MSLPPGILARGPWQPADVLVSWSDEPYAPPQEAIAEADQVLAGLRDRGSPAHDGLAARLSGFNLDDGRLTLECEPARWSLRLLSDGAAQSLSAMCVVRAADGRWLAGRRAAWLATWAERWALGAAGSVEVGENPAQTLLRELSEEWSVTPERMTVEALVKLPSGLVSLVGLAWLPDGTAVTPDAEHDEFAWWPADVESWPEHADAPLRRLAELVSPPG
ncbi:MAG TPA: NUDIX domain-containing protein [Solirubrobacteraceae bacterium]|nr:NUDIX domain-containing protein [Solirubrobacteraceae bacterium]